MRYVVFDIESTSKNGSLVRGRVDVDEQELTVVAVYDSETDAYTSYLREELPQLWPLLERTDALVGFNSDSFDIPLLNRYYPGDLTRIRSIDLLTDVQRALGRRIRLQSLAEATLGKGKSGDGLQAVVWWQQGLIEKVRAYCIEDVRITKELFEYAREHRALKYKDLRNVRDLKLDISAWLRTPESSPALTHALGL